MSDSDEPTHAQIEQRAYRLYVARGYEDGLDMEDWLAAEQQLMAEMKPTMQVPAEESRFQKANAASVVFSAAIISPA